MDWIQIRTAILKDVKWPDIASVSIAACSLTVSLRALYLQKRLSRERFEISACLDNVDVHGSRRHRLTVMFINRGPVPITLEHLGLAVESSNRLILPKWERNRTPLPTRLQIGEKAFAVYIDDEIGIEVDMERIRCAAASTASGHTAICHNRALRTWKKLARRLIRQR